MNAEGMRILGLGDSPTLTSGFARVLQNLLPRWVQAGAQVDCWGICYEGTLAQREHADRMGLRIFPGGMGNDWMGPKIQGFIDQLGAADYTHVFILQDCFQLSRNKFPQALRDICLHRVAGRKMVRRERAVRSVYYFPVDALQLEPAWCEIMEYVDRPVAYTKQGKRAAETAAREKKWNIDCGVVPHGVDADLYRPWPEAKRIEARAQMHFDDATKKYFLKADDFVVLNVNQNQRRKDFPRTLEVFAAFKQRVPKAKLVLHCSRLSSDGTDLHQVARQFGLHYMVDFVDHNKLFSRGMGLVEEADMPGIYNIADCYLSTTLGEGWGLGITEALACGLPCVVPDHTACAEIAELDRELGSDRILLADHEKHHIVMSEDCSRARYRTDLDSAVARLCEVHDRGMHRVRPELPAALRGHLDWDRLAEAMLAELKGEPVNASAPVEAVA